MSTSHRTDPYPEQEKHPPEWVSKIVIRQAVEADLLDMEWEGAYTRYRKNYAEVYQRTTRGKAIMWVLDLPGFGLVGQVFVQLKMQDRNCANGKTRAYIHSFRVRPAMRGHGLGTWLMNHAEMDLNRRGFREVTLNVAEVNEEALRLYAKLGYEKIKRIPGRWSYYDDKGVLRHISEPGFRLMKRLSSDSS
jgi:ribosomal protein S18 acetylase RimI-like enzyme